MSDYFAFWQHPELVHVALRNAVAVEAAAHVLKQL